jgi:hypothetical protein
MQETPLDQFPLDTGPRQDRSVAPLVIGGLLLLPALIIWKIIDFAGHRTGGNPPIPHPRGRERVKRMVQRVRRYF